MTGWRAWFDGRSPREKRLLIVMAALAVVTLLWGAIVRPVGDALASERSRHADAVTRLGATRAQVEAIRAAARDRPPPVTGTLADAVRARADQAGFTLASLDDQTPGRVRIGIQSARGPALIAWVARLERGGILVDAATFTDNGDRTLGVTMTLKARAS